MKVSLNWLREYVELPSETSALCELLTLAGVEVEGIETHGVAIPNVVVAQILESAQHPNADRLSVCKVDDGSGTPRQIVCGAKNYKVGDKVPLALPGAVLGPDFKIKAGKLRGVESNGMLCSAKELQLAEDADGLLILPPDARAGAPLSELFPSDTILDLEITPNRADLLSYEGIAREVAALTGKQLTGVEAAVPAAGGAPPMEDTLPAAAGTAASASVSIRLDAPELCSFYTARQIGGVKVGPSPEWLRNKLEAAGIRAINNVVDATNFVMLEMGQPLHAFDADKLQGGICVRPAGSGEEFLALDGRTYKLDSRHLLIADAQRGIAIAGVMGGEETGVTGSTANVLLESAYFQPASIRRTSRELGLISDSSYRFERGVDPDGVLRASQRAVDLILKIAGGTPGEIASAGAAPNFSRLVPLRPHRCDEILGATVPPLRIEQILSALGLEKTEGGWRVPSCRQDLTREIDLVEEVTRIFGIDNVPSRMSARFAPSSPSDRGHDRRMRLRQALAAQGFYEARTLTLVAPRIAGAQLFPVAHVLQVRNALTEDQVVLRPELVSGLIPVAAHNARAGVKSLALFEIGRVFLGEGREECSHLGIVMSGPVGEKSWRESGDRNADLFDIKGVLASILSGGDELVFQKIGSERLALAVEIRLAGKPIGHAGQLWPAEAREMDIAAPVLVAEIDLDSLASPRQPQFRGISKFPAITRDVAMLIKNEVFHGQVADVIRSANEPLLERVELFDVFADPAGEKTPLGQKSLAYSLTYRAADRTLSADEANAAHQRLKERLKSAFDVAFRE